MVKGKNVREVQVLKFKLTLGQYVTIGVGGKPQIMALYCDGQSWRLQLCRLFPSGPDVLMSSDVDPKF